MWTKCVGETSTFRLCGAGKWVSKLVVADSVSEHPEMRFLWQEADPVRTVEIGQAEVALHLVPLNWRAAD